jgi:rRNA processing protein Gar1
MLKMKINPGSSVGERRRGQLIYISLKKKKKNKRRRRRRKKAYFSG